MQSLIENIRLNCRNDKTRLAFTAGILTVKEEVFMDSEEYLDALSGKKKTPKQGTPKKKPWNKPTLRRLFKAKKNLSAIEMKKQVFEECKIVEYNH